jgi:oligopeptide transport system ATP-binding protein
MNEKTLLEIKNLNVSFNTYAGTAYAVRGIDFYLNKGENLAIVGESGCGKTVTAKAIMGLLPKPQSVVGQGGSEINFKGKNLLHLNESEMSKIRGKEISMIFQDPMTSLNPTMKIGDQIAESVFLHSNISHTESKNVALKMLELVRIPNAKVRLNQYPFEFSGGMRQRAMIAIALACNPNVLIADEPTTALDVTIQAQIMDLIADLQKELNTGVILVTHDLGVVASVADRIQVMYAGKIVERGTVDEIFYNPKHPYTLALLNSVPKLNSNHKETLYSLTGTPPDLINPPVGCPFAARCEHGMKICRVKHPETTNFSKTQECSCWLHDKRAELSGVPEVLVKRGEVYGC